jgi:hypothetical protein
VAAARGGARRGARAHHRRRAGRQRPARAGTLRRRDRPSELAPAGPVPLPLRARPRRARRGLPRLQHGRRHGAVRRPLRGARGPRAARAHGREVWRIGRTVARAGREGVVRWVS